MVDPKIMCSQHLLGEHVEIHMFIGSILKQKSLNGYIKNNLLEPNSLITRHDELVEEMGNRNMNHRSELPDFDLDYLLDNIKNYKIDRKKSLADLVNRCPTCRANCGDLCII
jgi:hypothetical protein